MEETIRSFAHHAHRGDSLVFKHYPLERGLIVENSEKYNVPERVRYIHGGHIPTLLRRAKGVVTVNSTVGLQALYHGAPVCATGAAFYARPGLACRGNLDEFWKVPSAPDRILFARFHRFMVHKTQINASFYVPASVRPERQRADIRRLSWRVGGGLMAFVLFAASGKSAGAGRIANWLLGSA